jgi:hypothetical protein
MAAKTLTRGINVTYLTFFGPNILAVYANGAAPTALLRIWGVVAGTSAFIYLNTQVKSSTALPAANPGVTNFTPRRLYNDMAINEQRAVESTDEAAMWDTDTGTWIFTSAGAIPTATGAAGGGVLGKATFDTLYGLAVNSGIVKIKLFANNGLFFDSANTYDLNMQYDSTGAISATAAGIKVNLEASNPTLQIDVTNKLGLKIKVGGGVSVDSNGVYVDVNGKIPLVSHTVDSTDAANFYLTLAAPVTVANRKYVRIVPVGGPEQRNHELDINAVDFGVGTDATTNLDRIYFKNTTGVARLSATATFTIGDILTIESRA